MLNPVSPYIYIQYNQLQAFRFRKVSDRNFFLIQSKVAAKIVSYQAEFQPPSQGTLPNSGFIKTEFPHKSTLFLRTKHFNAVLFIGTQLFGSGIRLEAVLKSQEPKIFLRYSKLKPPKKEVPP